MKKSLILLLMILGFGCSNSDDGTQGTVNLKVKGCFSKFENGAQICLDSVFNDSRCPTGLVCVWEGDAMAAFTITTKDEAVRSFSLHSNKKFQNDTVIGGIAIKLLNILPYPISDQTIEPSDYSVEISVDEN